MTKYLPTAILVFFGALPATVWALVGLYMLTLGPFSAFDLISPSTLQPRKLFAAPPSVELQLFKFICLVIYAAAFTSGAVCMWLGSLRPNKVSGNIAIGVLALIISLIIYAAYFRGTVVIEPQYLSWALVVCPLLAGVYLVYRWSNVI